ncbi:MAG: tyrosine-type recombinase/integrase [Bdellovibrionales bacterium]|nr:tyrosine-type recombinase/integrase [Bdellovibrionales bacterium]
MEMSKAVEGYWLHKTNLSKSTVADYKGTFKKFVEHVGDEQIEKLTADDVRSFLNDLKAKGLAGKTCCNAWVALSSLWTWACKEFRVEHIVRQVEKPKYRVPVVQTYTQPEIRAMVAGCEKNADWESKTGKLVSPSRATVLRDKAIVVLLVDTGMRSSELCALQMRHYNQQTGRIDIIAGKGDKDRVVYASTVARRYIWRYLAHRKTARADDPLFETATGNHMDRRGLLRMIQTLGDRCGIENAYVHKFRHTFAVNFIRNGGNPIELKNLLGHSDMNTVLIYVRLAAVDLENAQQRASVADRWKL